MHRSRLKSSLEKVWVCGGEQYLEVEGVIWRLDYEGEESKTLKLKKKTQQKQN